MITFEMIIAQLEAVADDVSYYVSDDGYVFVTIEDFGGFDDDGSTIDREFTDEAAVDALLEWLRSHADSRDIDLYYEYTFGSLTVHLGWASYEI